MKFSVESNKKTVMNFTGKINLLRFKSACVIDVQGKTMKKRGVFIPIDDNCLFVSADDKGNAKGVYVDFMAWENRQLSQFGDTHSIKQNYPKEVRQLMCEEDMKTIPYFGNLKPYEPKNAVSEVKTVGAVIEEMSDLPF